VAVNVPKLQLHAVDGDATAGTRRPGRNRPVANLAENATEVVTSALK
jgi:hypothetical protein